MGRIDSSGKRRLLGAKAKGGAGRRLAVARCSVTELSPFTTERSDGPTTIRFRRFRLD